MGAELARFDNKGMYKDSSISKSSNEFAYHNKNIRITTVGEESLLSITNEKGPLKKDISVRKLINGGYETIGTALRGRYIGHCITSNYIILFSHENDNSINPDRIYRIEDVVNNDVVSYVATELFSGDLGFSLDSPIETLFYYESDYVQKVYWVDGVHQTRVINIKKEDYSTPDQFNFVPNIGRCPTVAIEKSFDAAGSFHSGTIQYFITYYNKFGAETNIVWGSDLNYISQYDRGGAPDEFISCSFKLSISNLNNSFDYIRVYSAKRQSIDGPIELNIVDDIYIKNFDIDDSITIIDRGVDQESIDSNILLYLGGESFIAGSIAQKDDTLFLGNVKFEVESNPDLKEYIQRRWISLEDGFFRANRIEIDDTTYKTIRDINTTGFYPYNNQLNNSESTFKYFKGGEIYRFGIQYQTKSGEWTQPIWIGDKKCEVRPNFENGSLELPSMKFSIDEDVESDYWNYVKDYISYRLIMAETDTSTRSVLAQGVISPTMFNYDQRIHNKPFAISSYIMRPRGSNAEYRHFYPVKEIFGTNGFNLPINGNDDSARNPQAGDNIHLYCEVNAANEFNIPFWWGYKTYVKFYIYLESGGIDTKIEVDHVSDSSSYSCRKAYIGSIKAKLKELSSNLTDLTNVLFTESQHDRMHLKNDHDFDGWTRIDSTDGGMVKTYKKDITISENDEIFKRYLALFDPSKTNSRLVISKLYNNEYYVDESIVTFNSPELLINYNQINNNDLKFRLVGIAPLTSNLSDFRMTFTENDAERKGDVLSVPKYYNLQNKSTGVKTLFDEYLFSGITEDNGNLSNLDNYNIFMWHHGGSIYGSILDKTNYDVIENKLFSNERFSFINEYFETPEDIDISKPQIFNSDGISLLYVETDKSNSVYYGNYKHAFISGYDGVEVPREHPNEGDITKTDSPTSITFNSTLHAVISLCKKGLYGLKDQYVLPKLSSDKEFDECLRYSFLWNDDSPSIYDTINNNNITLANVYGILQWIGDEGDALKERIQQYVNAFGDESRYNDIYILISDSDTETSNPHIRFLYSAKCDIYTEEWTIEKVSGIYNYSFNLTPPPDPEDPEPPTEIYQYPHVPINKDTYGTIDWIIYGLDPSTDTLVDLSPYVDDKYKRCDTIEYECQYPYLFIAELYRDLSYESLYGGYEENDLEKISWIPITRRTNIDEDIYPTDVWGDTYYQRWDCVKTLPQSNSDINQVIDITSIMIESHICLDGRYDRNRGNGNILNINTDNFNLINDVYSQEDDLFKYNILDEKFNLDKFKNQIVWSKQKLPTDDIDTWTSISQLNSIFLDGQYGSINKLVNFNDTILAFQDKAIAGIKFNNDIQVSTENGLPIEVVNSGKVTGYDYISKINGATNKWAIHEGDSGLYFIDDLNKAMFRLNKDGLNNLSTSCGFSKWFKDNTVKSAWNPSDSKSFIITSDPINHDVYISHNDGDDASDFNCLCYNEGLQSFTSFYNDIYHDPVIFSSYHGRSIFIDQYLKIHHMFEGPYNREFSVEYKINPEPLADKTFTNVECIADTVNNSELSTSCPFEGIDVKTEYQHGAATLENSSISSEKFRIWRFDIPRNNKGDKFDKLDRIRNPWMNLRLDGNSLLDGVTTLHSLVVKYFK